MQRGLICFLLMFGVGFVQSQCVCSTTTQKVVYNNSDLVAKVTFKNLSVDEKTSFLVYNTTFLDVFKPGNASFTEGLVLADALAKNCNPLNFILVDGKEEYLLAAKKNDKNWQFKECLGFPQHSQGRAMPALPWDLITNKTLTNLVKGKF